MADKDTKPEGASDGSAARLSEKRVYDIKGGVKGKIAPILLTAVLLAVTVLAAATSFMANLDGEGTTSTALPVFLGGVSLLCWFGFSLLAILKRDRTLSKIIFVIFGISIIAFLALMLSEVGSTEASASTMIFGLFSLPYFAVYTLLEAVGLSTGGVVFTTTIIYAVIIAVNVWNFIRLRPAAATGKSDGEKKGFSLRMFEDGGRREDDKNKW